MPLELALPIAAVALTFSWLWLRVLFAPEIRKRKPSARAAGFKLFYSDQKAAEREEEVIYSELLVSEKWDLQGKPDYVLASGRDFLPIELKSGSIGDAAEPHFGDLMQLTVYFLILEDIYGIRPRYGRIIYRDFMFVVRNTKRLRGLLAEQLRDMREMLETGMAEAEPSFVKCKSCVCKDTVCEQM